MRSTSIRSVLARRAHTLARAPLACLSLCTVLGAAQAQSTPAPEAQGAPQPPAPFFVRAAPAQPATRYASGAAVTTDWQEVWRPMCGTAPGALSPQGLARMAALHDALVATGPVVVVDTPTAAAGINFVFNVSGSIPAGALSAIASAEAYMESQFSDPITVTISLSFASLGPGVLGGTSSFYTNVTWTTARAGLVAGKDAGDTIQDWLPLGATIPVRYANNATVTNENRVFFTRSNYRATIGSVTGNAASMQFSNTFAWDFDPSNGISGGTYSFVDVLIHETGHAMGFTSGVDFRVNDIEALDIFRFQRTDGTGDYNPDTLAEFQTRARLAAKNAPNDDHNCDLINLEYRMSDGSPYQASHFREQAANIGIMDPAFASAQTYYPNFYKAADLNMFDAIGYDH